MVQSRPARGLRTAWCVCEPGRMVSEPAVPSAPWARSSPAAPLAVVLAGVSGSGKSTVGQLLAARLHWQWADGDSFHSAANIAKMAARHPLTDSDRLPWLAEIGRWIGQETSQGRSVVVACSALKRDYRDVLRAGHPQVRIVYLAVDPDTLRSRMNARRGHMFAAEMLAGQLADLQPPTPDEDVAVVRSQESPEATVDEVIAVEQLERFCQGPTD